MILELLDQERGELARQKPVVEDRERMEVDAKLASRALPSEEATNKILRYDTMLVRQIDRAMTQLERLQRQRREGPVRRLDTAEGSADS